MAEGSGMVAVVRARRDAGLAVTLLDGGRQYTLMPDEAVVPTVKQFEMLCLTKGKSSRPHQPQLRAMAEGSGMVAVVRARRDAGLAVTLLDGGRQYTLMPDEGKPSPPPQVHITPRIASPAGLPARLHLPGCQTHHNQSSMTSAPNPQARQQRDSSETVEPPRCDSGAQATDGRYASMYKMAHCSVNPTSPPVQLTEFPPQRASLCPGHGNFEVGGSGSGENYVPCRSPGSFRGGLSWPDRGSVCSPRSSRQPDAFANSLRKYPNMSLERSTEMIERLITYTQAKNLSKTHPNRCQSPSRHGIESNASNPIVPDRSLSRNTVTRPCYQNSYEPEVKIRIRQEDSPTRDARDLRGGDCECAEYRRVVKTADSRCVNMTKKMKENGRSYSYTLPFQQCASPGIRDRYEHNYSIPGQHTPSLLTATNSVNMEVQAAAEMVSREVATVPRAEPVKRTVAVPLSRTSSSDDQKREGDVSQIPARATNRKSVEASTTIDLSVQTTSSNINASSHQCSCFVARRKSEERLKLEKELSEEIMELLDKVSVCPNADPKACDLRREVLKQMSEKLQKMSENMPVYDELEKNKDRIGNLLKYVPIWIPSGDVQSYRDAISDEIISKMNHYKTYNEVYRAETQIKMRTDRNTLDDLLHNVIGSMPIKTMDIFGKPVEKNRIVETYVKRLKRLITNISDKTDTSILKPEILVLISKIPIAISTYNKIAYLNKVVDSIITKLKDLNLTEFYFEGLKTKLPCLDRGHEKKKMIDARLKKYVQPTEEELREYISDELNVFLEKHDLQVDNINVVETDLIDILIDSIQDIRLGKDDNVANEIMLLLLQTVEALPDNLAKKFTEKILDNIKQLFNSKTTKVINKPVKIDSQSYILQNPPRCSKEDSESLDKVSDLSIEATPKDGVNANLDEYMNYLMQQIEEWLDNLKVKIPQARDSGFRQVVVNDLAGDIVDRHKYLELNPSSRGTDEDELEHLRYQIFKWINKLAGENNMRTIANASDLMNRIQNIPIPKLGEPQENIYSPGTSKCDPISNRENDSALPRYRRAGITSVSPDPAKGTVIPKCTSQVLLSTNKSNIRLSMDQTQGNRNGNPATCCSGSVLGPTSPSMKQLNDEYDEFLKKWTEEIPIPSCGPKEKAAADKARQGIYNGVWKAVTKLKFDPATFHNPFYYEDALDDELEELFGMLPNSQELETKKHLLKVQLIEKTTITNELIKSTSAPASFKQHLVESVYKSLSEITNSDPEDDARKRHEELQILKLVDNFILCTKYKEEDRSKASVYRNKLIRETQALIENMKNTHGKELQHINPDSYINSILISLQKVPLPNEEIIQDEANEILLSHEVDQWFSDLPLAESNADGELQRKMLKDSLVKKVHEIEKEVNIFDCTGERVLKHEISNFLEKLPLQDGANENISFIADEFSNRMKNRAGQLQNNTARKSVAFMDSVGYFEFSRQLPQCSSFSKLPNAKPAVIDQSSLMIRGGSIVKDPYMGARYYGQQDAYEESPKDLPSDQYFTIQDSRYPNPPKQDNRPMQAPENVEWQSIPMATASNIPVSSLVTNNFTVQLCGNIQTFDRDCAGRHPKSPANIKAVQTSVSSVDLTKQECCFCRRKIRSQEDLRNRHRDVLLQNEVLEWLKETYATNPSSRLWGEKMQRLAQKLKRPGGEERIRQKIQRYLKRVPSQFSECDEDRREFREQLPDNIIRKLKKMYLKPDKKRRYNSSPVRILRIEVPKHENDSTRNNDTLICSIDDWLKEIPIKKKDFLGRSIRKEDVLKSVVNKVEPYILNRHNFDKDYKHTLKTIVLNILNEMPIEIDDNDKTTFLKRLALSLVSDILNIDNNDRDVELLQNVNVSGKEREIKAFVMNEVATVMTKLHLSISTKRLALLEEELKHTFVDANTTSDCNDESVMKDNVFIILHNLGGLSSYQANYFTDIMVKHFKEEYCVNKDNTSPNHDDTCKPSLTGVTLNETYSVFHNVSKTKSTVSTRSLKSTSNGNKKGDVSNLKQQIIEQIQQWLQSLQLQIPVKKKVLNKAVRDLAEDVLDRLKYLELNPTCKGSEEDETQYLKYQIFKWFNKVAGEQITKTIEHALELMNRIQTVNAAVLSKSQENNINQPSSTCNYGSLNKTRDLKVTISKHSRRKWQSPTNKDSCNWMDNKLNPTITDEKIRNTLSLKSIKIDSKLEKICTRNFEDIIDDWIDTIFCEKFGETLDYENRNEHIREFAIKMYDSLNKSKSSERKTQIERMAYKWLQKLPFRLFSDQASFEKDCITKLVDSLLSIKPTEGNDILNDRIGSVTENSMDFTRNCTEDLIVEAPDEHVNDIEEKSSRASNVTVYGCTLPSTSREGVKSNNQDVRIGYNEDDIEANTEMYLKQLVENIDEWLRSLQIPQIHDKGFREIVVNDLAADIIDRKKYLELNPSSRGTDENELEQLKYQIFKWINKLVGENQKETVERASELMDRIHSIPVPMLVKQSERDCKSSCPQMQKRRNSKSSPSTPNVSGYKSPANKRKLSSNANQNTAKSCLGEGAIAKSKTPQSPSGVKLSSPLGFTTGPMANSNQNINQMSSGSSKRSDKKNVGSTNVNKNDNSQFLACPELCDNSEESEGLPLGMTIEEVYQHYDNIIKQRVQEIPLETPTSEQAMLADLARKGLYNGIWKAYFQLKANPDVENDYSYFEMLFEDHIDDILDCLPQTEEMQKTRPGWKSKLLMDVMNMLKYIHSITDTPSFRQKIAEKFDRKFVKAQYQESSNLHQHGFVVRTAEAYILYSNYREDDPIKANIYKQRLMKRIEELANAVKSDNNVDFRYINQAQLCQIAMQMLETVPVPQGEALKDEANEILIGEEIEHWYNALPVMPIRNETDEILRKRMRELLAKRLCEIEKGFDIDDSAAETNMKHEVSQFLHEKAVLQPNEDLNIDFMVEELTNRLKTRKQQGQLEYESFVKEAPVSSTFVQTDPGEVLAPLVDIGDDINNNESMLQNAPDKSDRGENPLFTSQCGRHSIPGPVQAIDTRANNQGNGGRISITSGLGDTSFVRSCCQPQPRLSAAIDRSLVPNGAPQDGQQYSYADGNRRSSTREDRQAFGQHHLSGQLQPSYVSRDPSPTGATGSTARLATVNPEEQFEEGEVRYKCRCMERVWRCKRRRVCEESDRYPRCFPMPFPCRHFY